MERVLAAFFEAAVFHKLKSTAKLLFVLARKITGVLADTALQFYHVILGHTN